MVSNKSIVLEVTVRHKLISVNPNSPQLKFFPQLDPQNACDRCTATQRKGKFGREDGMERDSSLNWLWLKCLTFANFIRPYDCLNTRPGPWGREGGHTWSLWSLSCIKFTENTPLATCPGLCRLKLKFTSRWKAPNGITGHRPGSGPRPENVGLLMKINHKACHCLDMKVIWFHVYFGTQTVHLELQPFKWFWVKNNSFDREQSQ